MKVDHSISICCDMWRFIDEGQWDKVRAFLSSELEVIAPQSREKVVGCDGFIDPYKNFSGERKIQICDYQHSYDKWDHTDHVVTQVFITSTLPGEAEASHYVLSFFELDENTVTSTLLPPFYDEYPYSSSRPLLDRIKVSVQARSAAMSVFIRW